jgi:hypothetical protein
MHIAASAPDLYTMLMFLLSKVAYLVDSNAFVVSNSGDIRELSFMLMTRKVVTLFNLH